MPGFAQSELPPLILKGIRDASKEYLKTNDGWLWRAPEYWVTTSIAKSLMRGIHEAKRVVSLETSVTKTLTAAGAKQRGPKKTELNAGGRFDIVVGHGNAKPRAVIEVKSPIVDSKPTQEIFKDLNRLVATLGHGRTTSNIKCAIFAFYSDIGPPQRRDRSASEKLARKFGGERSEFNLHIKEFAKRKGVRSTYFVSKVDDQGTDGARIWGCVLFTRMPAL